jgi:hypothetical protein
VCGVVVVVSFMVPHKTCRVGCCFTLMWYWSTRKEPQTKFITKPRAIQNRKLEKAGSA